MEVVQPSEFSETLVTGGTLFFIFLWGLGPVALGLKGHLKASPMLVIIVMVIRIIIIIIINK